MYDPWAFGWTQLLTIIGFMLTTLIAIGGFRSFERWRREKIEEKRIDAAIEAFVLIREAKWVFDNIRRPMSFDYEWKDMPETPGDDADRRHSKGTCRCPRLHGSILDGMANLSVQKPRRNGPNFHRYPTDTQYRLVRLPPDLSS